MSMVLKIYLTDGTVVAILLAQYETSAEPIRLHNYNVSLQPAGFIQWSSYYSCACTIILFLFMIAKVPDHTQY
jgi:hypothetical protein